MAWDSKLFANAEQRIKTLGFWVMAPYNFLDGFQHVGDRIETEALSSSETFGIVDQITQRHNPS
jgi:hypothetical protein